MTAEEMWKLSGLEGYHEAWAFGEVPDKLAALVLEGKKTATSSSYILYKLNDERVPQAGDYSIILDSRDNALCIIRTVKADIVEYGKVTEEFARKEGEGDLSLDYWREVHQAFFTQELQTVNLSLDDQTLIVCEEFEVVFR